MTKLTKSRIDAAKPRDVEYLIWDHDLSGFGLRVFPTGRKTYFVQYRMGRRTRRLKLGTTSVLTADQARIAARKALGRVANGTDPAEERRAIRNDITVSALCDLYLSEACATKKPSTLATDRGRIARHIKPLLGNLAVGAVQQADVERFMKDVAAGKTAVDEKTGPQGWAHVTGGRGTASRTVGLLGSIFTYARKRALRPDNPVHGVRRFKDRRMERFLTFDELNRLGLALKEARKAGASQSAIAAIELLAMTGCRRGEILSLEWKHIDWDARCFVLPESKTGHKIVPVGEAVVVKLLSLRPENADGYVFPGRAGGHYNGVQKVWKRVRTLAKLNDVRLHDLRHTFISTGINAGLSLSLMGKVAGHSDTQTTARYAHLIPGATHGAANQVSELVAKSMKADA